jgi:hypothetical protein
LDPTLRIAPTLAFAELIDREFGNFTPSPNFAK